MRSVLVVLGIAALFALLSVVLTKPKGLSPNPQDEVEAAREKEQAAEARKAMQGSGSGGPITSPNFKPPREGVVTVELAVQNRGTVTLELYPKAAPKTVKHFVELASRGFYNGLKFHRVVPGFVVQGGDPGTRDMPSAQLAKMSPDQIQAAGIGAGGSGSPVEFESNSLPHMLGTLSLALSAPSSPTGDSQFFVDLASNKDLNGKYCVFGSVAKGMDVVQKIEQGDAITSLTVRK
jgi:peptidyl-prolyl cis-trans isomerase B (cyclophilin B)